MPLKDKERERAYQRAYRAANRERIAELKRVHYLANYEEIRKRQNVYRKANPEVMTKGMVAWRKRHPEKIATHRTYWNAVIRGKVKRASVCSKCGEVGQIDAHHADYSKPLEVEFLCRPCHVNEHNNQRDNTHEQ